MYKGVPPGTRELLVQLQADQPLSADAPKRFHPNFYAEVARIRAARKAASGSKDHIGSL